MELCSGDLRSFITIQLPEGTVDTAGGRKKTFATHAKGWAQIKPLKGHLSWYSGASATRVTHRITMRWVSGVVAGKMQVLFGTRQFRIHQAINEDERSKWLVMNCEEGEPA